MGYFLPFVGKLFSYFGVSIEEEEIREPLIDGPNVSDNSTFSHDSSSSVVVSRLSSAIVPNSWPKEDKPHVAKEEYSCGDQLILIQQSNNLVSRSETSCLISGSSDAALEKPTVSGYLQSEDLKSCYIQSSSNENNGACDYIGSGSFIYNDDDDSLKENLTRPQETIAEPDLRPVKSKKKASKQQSKARKVSLLNNLYEQFTGELSTSSHSDPLSSNPIEQVSNTGNDISVSSSQGSRKKGKLVCPQNTTTVSESEPLESKKKASHHQKRKAMKLSSLNIQNEQLIWESSNWFYEHGHIFTESDSSPKLVLRKVTSAVHAKTKDVMVWVAKEKSSCTNHLISVQQSHNLLSSSKQTCLVYGSTDAALDKYKSTVSEYLQSEEQEARSNTNSFEENNGSHDSLGSDSFTNNEQFQELSKPFDKMGTFLVFVGKLLSCCGICIEEEEIRCPVKVGSRNISDDLISSQRSAEKKMGQMHHYYYDYSKETGYDFRPMKITKEVSTRQNKQLAVEPPTSSHFGPPFPNSATPVTRIANGVSVPSIKLQGSSKNGCIPAESGTPHSLLGSQKTRLVPPKVTSAIEQRLEEVKPLVAEEKPSSKGNLISIQQSQNSVSGTKTSCLVNGSTYDALNKTTPSAYLPSQLFAAQQESCYYHENNVSHPHKKVSSNSTKDFNAVESTIQGYCSSQKILLVGEGDFSFSACLAKAFGSATNMVATSLNSEEYLKTHYSDAMNNIYELRTRGCKVFHEVDATAIRSLKNITNLSFDRIIYNFPHCGDFSSTGDARRKNQVLVRWFMKNSTKLVKQDGEIHIRHKSTPFFLRWNLRLLASQAGLVLIDEAPFDASEFSGYNTKYGFPGRHGMINNFDCHSSCTYKFVLSKCQNEARLQNNKRNA